jgi:hypothetical protein
LHAKRHFTGWRELDSVASEIDQHLPSCVREDN